MLGSKKVQKLLIIIYSVTQYSILKQKLFFIQNSLFGWVGVGRGKLKLNFRIYTDKQSFTVHNTQYTYI